MLVNLNEGNILPPTLKPLLNWTQSPLIQLHISMPHEQYLTDTSSVAF